MSYCNNSIHLFNRLGKLENKFQTNISDGSFAFEFIGSTSRMRFSSESTNIINATNITKGSWIHIGMTSTAAGGSTIFYIDGSADSTTTSPNYNLSDTTIYREGTPLICTRTAGSRDIINEKENGLFIDLKDEFSLCNSLEDIIKKWELYSKNSLKTFHENYSMNNLETHFKKIKYFTN